MLSYTHENTLRIAKRFNNAKRTYLLVNPLQSKHIPASPTESLEMMWSLGDILCEKYPDTKLVIGFAETATAIGAVVASRFPGDCQYIHTTREDLPGEEDWILFLEEHSHAVQQKLCARDLGNWFASTDTIIFVDDEISTGKTLINMCEQLKERYPDLASKQLVAASLLNRVSPENEQKMNEAGLRCEYLVKLPEMDYTAAVADLQVSEAVPVPTVSISDTDFCLLRYPRMSDPRTGVSIDDYTNICHNFGVTFVSEHSSDIDAGSRILVLGTEEYMYPAIALGKAFEEAGMGYTVRCHATTRSPIGICDGKDYPIRSGSKLPSFYDVTRPTYIYNQEYYDVVIVVTDAPLDSSKTSLDPLLSLISAWKPYGYKKLFFVQGGPYVWNV